MDNALEIFFSYGHSEEGCNELPPIVAWLKSKITERKHTVFIDVERLPDAKYTNWPNSDWRKAIYTGINESDSVLGLLSERGLRENGVCLDELSIAVSNPGRNIVTVLLESQAKLKIPPTISRIQWVDMSDWKNHWNGDFNNDYFEEKFNEIIKRIESRDNFLYQADINFLMQALNPSVTVKTSLFDLLKKESNSEGEFVYENRLWLNDILTDFIKNSNRHYLLFCGGAGYGKSQFLAHCIHHVADVCAYYFIKYDKAKDNCNEFLRTLAFELAAKLPDYRESLINAIRSYPCFNAAALDKVLDFYMDQKNDSDLFDLLFHCDRIHTIYGGGDVVICIDALDEAEVKEKGNNPVVDLLINKRDEWPHGFKFVLTSRNESDIFKRLDIIRDIQKVNLDSKESDNDICKYLTNRLVKTGKVEEKFINQLVIDCEKTFIYADLLVQSIYDGTIKISSEEDLHSLPKGYSGLLLRYFERLFSDGSYASAKKPLGLMVANGGSISVSVIDAIMKTENREWNHKAFIMQMKSFVVDKDAVLSFYHKSINDWLVSDDASVFYICVNDYKKDIIEFDKSYLNQFERLRADDYADITGFELLDDAMSDDTYQYEIVKFVYQSYLRFSPGTSGTKLHFEHIAFIALVIYEAYKKSDLYFSRKVFEPIKTIAANFKALNDPDKFYTALIYSIISEIEIAKGNEIPEAYVENKNLIGAENCEYAIDYLYFIENVFPELPDYPKLYCSVMDNIGFVTRLWKNKKEEALSIIEELEKYIGQHNFNGKAYSYAHMYYHKAVMLFVLNRLHEAVDALKKSVVHIKLYESEVGGDYSYESMRSLVYNEFGACYNKLGRLLNSKENKTPEEFDEMQDCFAKSLEYIDKSLKIKQKEYGSMSFYVATACNNYASWKKDAETAQKDFKALSHDVYDYVNKAIYIREYIFSEKGVATAMSYMTMAYCLEADKNYHAAFAYAKKAYEISPTQTNRKSYDRIRNKMNGESI